MLIDTENSLKVDKWDVISTIMLLDLLTEIHSLILVITLLDILTDSVSKMIWLLVWTLPFMELLLDMEVNVSNPMYSTNIILHNGMMVLDVMKLFVVKIVKYKSKFLEKFMIVILLPILVVLLLKDKTNSYKEL